MNPKIRQEIITVLQSKENKPMSIHAILTGVSGLRNQALGREVMDIVDTVRAMKKKRELTEWPGEPMIPWYSLTAKLDFLLRGGEIMVKYEDIFQKFQNGLPIQVNGRQWYATLDIITEHFPIALETAALVRFSLKKPEQPVLPEYGPVQAEQRNRKLFAETPLSKPNSDDDLLLCYFFISFLPLEDNIRFFEEFAMKDISRLRGKQA